jgi:hypothetical protein
VTTWGNCRRLLATFYPPFPPLPCGADRVNVLEVENNSGVAITSRSNWVWVEKTKGEYELKKATYPNAGKVWYISAWFDGENGQRKKKRAWFSSQKAAQTEANERNDKIHRLGRQAAVQITGVLANMALECQWRLEVYGKSLSDATVHYLQHLESLNRSVPIRQMSAAVRTEFQQRIGAGEISQRHLETILAALRRMDEQFGDRASSTITGWVRPA